MNLPDRVRAAAECSELVRAIQSVTKDGGLRFAVGEFPVRSLSKEEIAALERGGNFAQDWSRVRVADGFDPQRVTHSTFVGDVVLGRFQRQVSLANGLELPAGIYFSTVGNCVIGNDAHVREVKLLANFVVGESAVLFDCGAIRCDGTTSFGNGQELPIAIETGGRDVRVFAEIDVEIAAAVARSSSQRELLKQYADAVGEYVKRATCTRGIIDHGAVVRNTRVVRNAYVGPHAEIDGATLVADSTILSNNDEPAHIQSGACVTKSLVQWGSHVTTMAIVDRSVLTEHSHVERHGKVTASILGPNTGVAEGEVTSCLLGPFVGFHHQALLIAVLWPEGKGNVGYGANVGSNHTSKAPDQEFWPGEGAFLGLGVNIKYPADLSRAPYTIVASGVTTLPQKVTFPFSLINSPAAAYTGISPAYNEIIPAWLLTDNMFTLKRNEGKYKARNKAKRTQFEFDVFRPEIVELMRDSCRRLVAVREVKEAYTDHDIGGLGKNFMLETYRKPAIEAYRFYTQYYALLGLLERVQAQRQNGSSDAIPQLLSTPSDEPPWEHRRRILFDEFGMSDTVAALRELPQMLQMVAADVERSKAKDDERGRRIIDDYTEVHTPAANDKFVKQTWDETRHIQREVEELIAALMI
jgi:hypothetical protein